MMQQKERLEKQLDFIREIDKEKEIFRGLSFCHIVLLYKIQKARLSPG